MRYTPLELFPYPTGGEAANGAVHMQALAERVDAKLDSLDVEWPARQKREARSVKLSGDQSVVNGFYAAINWSPVDYSTGGIAGSQSFRVETSGWYLVTAHLLLTNTSLTANSRRRLRISVYNFASFSSEPEQSFSRDVFEPVGPVGFVSVTTSLMCHLYGDRVVRSELYHENTASAILATANWSNFTAELIFPDA